MKTSKFLSALILLLIVFTNFRCSKDSAATITLVAVSGKVTYTNAAGTVATAVGAVVKLASTVDTVSAITNKAGLYTFPNVKSKSYTLVGSYFTDNKNITGRLEGLTFASLAPEAITVASTAITKDLTLTSAGQTGIVAMAVNYAWNPSATPSPAYANTAPTWIYDSFHSPVIFEFPYRNNEATFGGGISQLSKAIITFDPANLAGSSINVEVDLTSINTRAPGGRDNLQASMDNPVWGPDAIITKLGCIMGTFGITADGTLPAKITLNPKRYAQFVSTSIAKLGDGYVAKGNVTFNGITKAADIWFKGVPPWLDTTNSRTYAGFEGRFTLNAKTDFNIVSSSLNDAAVKIQISIVMYHL